GILDGYSESSYSATPRFAAARLPWFWQLFKYKGNHMKRPSLAPLKFQTIKSRHIDRNELICKEWVNNKHISIVCTNEINGTRFKLALNKLSGTVIGKELIKTLNILTTFKKINILIDLNSSDTGVVPDDIDDASNFRGCGSTLMINFNHDGITRNDGISAQDKDCIVLFHELLHVYHNAVGEKVRIISNKNIYSPNLHEEARTVGLGSFRKDLMTENKLREEMGLPRRSTYYSVNDQDEILTFRGTFNLFPIR
ncbi:M91 family zinc metallopeptidase, partial [Escherichia coli]|uniref:M91 family zinc metallopeptidase n=1 Tax=Escherichia coli TaxID=562 RepID=UPI001BC89B99